MVNGSPRVAFAGRLSRRSALARGMVLAAAAAVPASFLASRTAEAKVMKRCEVGSKQGGIDCEKLSKAIGLMKRKGISDPYSYDYQAGLHGVRYLGLNDKAQILDAVFGRNPSDTRTRAERTWNTCISHYGSQQVKEHNAQWFISWHRMYLYYFERIAQHVLMDATFRLPYWNYCEPDNRILPGAFRDVQSPLYNPTRHRDPTTPYMGRTPEVRNGAPFDGDLGRRTQALLLTAAVVRPTDFEGFRESIKHPHDQVHQAIGWDMGNVPTAAHDPVFWLHHANLDRLWSIWLKTTGPNKATRANPSTTEWRDKTFSFIDVGDTGPVVRDARTSEFLDSLPLLYVYDDEKGEKVQATLLAAKPRTLGTAPGLPAGARLIADATGLSGGRPLRLTFTPQHAEATLRRMAASADDQRAIRMTLHNVQASRQPGASYSLYLDLPEDDAASDVFWAGELTFFDNIVQPGGPSGSFGADSRFDITETVFRLATAGLLAEQTSLTVVPRGDPATIVSFASGTISLTG